MVDWLSYARTMPRCAAVICHAGHGTVARALASGVPVVGCPAAGDMAENAARLAWAGCGVSLPRRLVTPRGIRLAVRKLLAEPGYAAAGAGAARLGAQATTAARSAARAVEELAADAQRTARLGNCRGGTRTHNHHLNRVLLCLIELPGTYLGYVTAACCGSEARPPSTWRDN